MGDDRTPLPARMAKLAGTADDLLAHGWRARAEALGAVGARFLDDADPLRARALRDMPADSGLSPDQCKRLLGAMARDWTSSRLVQLVRAEFEEPDVLDGWADDRSAPGGRRLRTLPLAWGVGLHICAGTVPGVAVSSLIRGLLVGSPVLLKPGAGDRTLPRLFIEGLGERGARDEAARTLAEACAELYWRGGVDAVEDVALAGAAYVVVYGGTETVTAVRRRVAATTPVVAYGHRMGLAIVGAVEPDTGAAVAEAVADFDQRGCVSPHQVFVVGSHDDEDPLVAAPRLAEAIARRLATLAEELPAGAPSEGVAAAVQQLRGTAELRGAAGEAVRCWAGPGVSWTVVLDPVGELKPPVGARTVFVTPVKSLTALGMILAPAGHLLQSVGLSGFESHFQAGVADYFGRLGASRIVSLDRLAYPPAWWIHDGQGPLRRLVRWVEWGPTPGPAAAPPAR